jgi:hypothetical protein
MTTTKRYDLARMTTATTGTGSLTLGSAVNGFLTFAGAGASDQDVLSYFITDGSNSEVGFGTYSTSAQTLTRTVLKSTNGNTAISLSGSAQVMIGITAEDITDLYNQLGGPFTKPTTSQFTWFSQPTSSTATDTNTGLVLRAPGNNGDSQVMLERNGSYPSTPFTFTVGLEVAAIAENYETFGLYIRDGSTTKNLDFGLLYSNGIDVTCQYWSATSTYSSSPFAYGCLSIPKFFSLQDDGTNFIFRIGNDLNSMVKIYSVGRTAYFTAPGALGLYMNRNTNTSGLEVAATFFHVTVG